MGEVTQRDLRMLAWIGRHQAVMARQVARRFELAPQTIYKRLGVLGEYGLVAYQRGLAGAAGVWLITAEGQKAVGIAGVRPPSLGLGSWVHDLGLVDLSLDYEARDVEVVTEREARMEEAAVANGRFSIIRAGQEKQPGDLGRHFPDLWIFASGNGSQVAVELELTGKSTARLRALLAGYRKAGHVTGVIYVCGDDRIRRRVELVGQQVGLRDEEEPTELGLTGWAYDYSHFGGGGPS